MAGGFLVSGGAVDLASEEQTRDFADFKRQRQLPGVNGVVLDCIAGANHFGVFKTGDRRDHFCLDIDGHARGHAIHVNLIGVESLRLQEQLMPGLVGELYDLVLDRWAIAWPDGFDLPAVER